jgi:hypothetical protein
MDALSDGFWAGVGVAFFLFIPVFLGCLRWEKKAMKTVYIVPAWSDQAGQCRIVATVTAQKLSNVARDYDHYPDKWREVGIMNSQGKLVCYDGKPEERAEILSCEPLAAGMVFEFEGIHQPA